MPGEGASRKPIYTLVGTGLILGLLSVLRAARRGSGSTEGGSGQRQPGHTHSLTRPVANTPTPRRPPSVFDAGSSVALLKASLPAPAVSPAPSRPGLSRPGLSQPAAADKPAEGFRAYKWQAFSAIGLAFLTIVMSTTMVFVLLSSIADDFGVTLRAVGWVVIIESLVISALLLPMGGVADAIGRRRVYLTGLTVFGIGSVISGFAPTFATLIIARMVMAVGNAGVQSVITGMLVAAFPPQERGRAMGAQTTSVSIGAACGPLLGGLALQVVSWRVLFVLLALPVSVAIVVALIVLRDDRPDAQSESRSFDRVGSLLSSTMVIVLVFTISNPFAFRWLSTPVAGGFLTVAALLGLFVRYELRRREPVLELRLFAIAAFRRAVLVRLFGFVGYASIALLLPIYLVSVRGLSGGAAGGVLFMVSVGTGISAQVAGNLSDRVGPRAPTIVGLVLQMSVCVLLILLADNISIGWLAGLVFIQGFAASLWNVPNNSAMMGAVPPENLGVIGAFTNVTRTMGSVLGQAVATAVVVAVMVSKGFDLPLSDIAETAGAASAFIAGWDVAFVVVAASSAIALLFSLGLPASPIGVPEAE